MGVNDLEQLSGDDLTRELIRIVSNTDTQVSNLNTQVSNLNVALDDMNTKIEKVLSENRARHYDMQNIGLASNGMAISGHVSSSQAAGRSPRTKLNSHDTYH